MLKKTLKNYKMASNIKTLKKISTKEFKKFKQYTLKFLIYN